MEFMKNKYNLEKLRHREREDDKVYALLFNAILLILD